MHAHRLRSDRDAAFLREGRADPFSRVRLQPGATVVRCAACGTVFLRESWQALGERHCGQTQTAATLTGPAAPAYAPAASPAPAPVPAAAYPDDPAPRRRSMVPWVIVGAVALAALLAVAWLSRGGSEPAGTAAVADSAAGAVVPRTASLRVGDVDGRLEEGDEQTEDGRFRDTYTFETRGRGPFAFAVEASFEPDLVLVAPDGRRVAAPLGAADRSRAQVVLPNGPGLYTVEVASRARGAEGAYTLSLQPNRASRALRLDEIVQDSLGGPDAYRNNDHFETAYTLALEEGARVTLGLQTTGFAPQLHVTGPGGAVRAEAALAQAERTYRFTAPAAGRYTLVLSAAEAARGGPYRLRVATETPPRIRALGVGEPLTGTMAVGETHRFRFDGISGQRLLLAVAAQGFVPRTVLLDASGSRVATGSEALTWTLGSTGPFTIEVSAADSTTGGYSITARVVATADEEGGVIRSEIRREPPGRELPSETERPVGGATYVVDGTSRRVQAALLPENPGVEATGTYRLSISSEGTVTQAEIVRRSGHAVLDADALRALVRWRFEGGSRPETATVTIRFSVRD